MKHNLTGSEGGRWTVTTVGSEHQFDLDLMTVTRIPGAGASPTVNDQTRPLLEIVHCTVGERGYWRMRAEGVEADVLEHYWHFSSTIQAISPIPADPTTSRPVIPPMS